MEFNFGAVEQIIQDVTNNNAAGTYKAPSNSGHNHEFSGNQIVPREEVLRDMEKAMIREQIMAEEMMRKRALEAEVRMEIMIERQIALRTGNPFSYLPEASGSDSRFPIVDQLQIFKSLEERMAVFIEERIGRLTGGQPVAVAEPLPFQRSVEPTIKETVFPLVIPNGNLGQKRKALTPPEVGPTDLIFKKLKPSKEEWSCAICQVSATNEHQLNDHLSGKKHKLKELALKSQKERKKFGIGLIPKEKTLMLEGKKDTLKKDEAEMKVEDASEHKSTKPVNKKRSTAGFKFWCEMCEVATRNKTHMEAHKAGKRHKENLEQIVKISCDAGDKVLPEKVSPQIVPPEQITRVNSDSGDSVPPENMLLEKVLSVKDLLVNHSPEKVKKLESEKEILRKDEADLKVEDELKQKITNSTKPANKKRSAAHFKFWCEMCEVVTRNKTHMEAHKAGKRHKENLEQVVKISCDAGDKVPPEIVSPEKVSAEQITKVNSDAGDKVLLEKVLPEKVSPQIVPLEQITRVNSDSGDNVPLENVLLEKVLSGKDLLVNHSPEKAKKLESEKEILRKDEADMKVEDELKQKITNSAKTKHSAIDFKYWCEMCKIGADYERIMEAHKKGKKHKKKFIQIAKVSDARDKFLAENVSPAHKKRNRHKKNIKRIAKVSDARDNVLPEYVSPENVTYRKIHPNQIMKVNSDAGDKVPLENALLGKVLHAGDKVPPENVSPEQIKTVNCDAGDKVPPENSLPGKVLHAGNKVLLEYVSPEKISSENAPPEQITKVDSDAGDKVPPKNALPEKVSHAVYNVVPESISPEQITKVDSDVGDKVLPKNALAEKVSHAVYNVVLENISLEQITKVDSDAGDKVPPENALPEKVLHAVDNVVPENVSPEQITIVNSDAEDKVTPENVLPGEFSLENVVKPESKHFKDDKAFWCLICEEGCQNFSMWAVHTKGEMHIEKLNTLASKRVTGTENIAAGDKGLLNFFGGGDRVTGTDHGAFSGSIW